MPAHPAPEQRDHRQREQRDLKRAQRPPRRHPHREDSEDKDRGEDHRCRGSLYPVFMTTPLERIRIGLEEFDAARARVSAHAYHTPLLTSRLLSERTGFDVRLKAEIFQRTGSYKIRGPLNKIP